MATEELSMYSVGLGCISGVSLESVGGNDFLAEDRISVEGSFLIGDLSSVHQEVQFVQKGDVCSTKQKKWKRLAREKGYDSEAVHKIDNSIKRPL
ncbi:hypothetical protein ACOSQ2_002056 [Xanthoceras sorbifolium]